MTISQQDAAKALLKLRKAQSSFEGYVRYRQPKWDIPDFHLELINILDMFEKDTLVADPTRYETAAPAGTPIRKLLITMPPRHSKSTYSTVLFPSYFMLRKPDRFTMTASYNTKLAGGFGRQVREIVLDPKTGRIFPAFKMTDSSRAIDEWWTDEGGAYFALGLGGTTSGRPANLLIVDDPIKSRKEAESPTMRNNVWEYYIDSLQSRLQPEVDNTPAREIIILTRWHPDDLAGRIMETDDWKEGLWQHIDFQAIIDENLPTERALWPVRFPLKELKRKQRLAPRNFAALYQQKPYIEGGNLIQSKWWQYYNEDDKPEQFATIVIGADTAFKKNEDNDYSVAIVAGIAYTGDIYILDVFRKKMEYPMLKRNLIRLNALWRGRGMRGLYVEDKASGQSLIQELKQESGISVIPIKVIDDKVARVHVNTGLIEGGRVFLPQKAHWLEDFLIECEQFPNAKHDDQVDALTIVLEVLSKVHVSPDMDFGQLNVGSSLNNQVKNELTSSINSSLNQLLNKSGILKSLGS